MHAATSRAECAAWLCRYAESRAVHGFAPWTVMQPETEQDIGWSGPNIDLLDPGWGAPVSCLIHPACAGHGLVTQLVQAAVQHGFGHPCFDRIGAFPRPESLASVGVLPKCGFALLGYEPTFARNQYELA